MQISTFSFFSELLGKWANLTELWFGVNSLQTSLQTHWILNPNILSNTLHFIVPHWKLNRIKWEQSPVFFYTPNLRSFASASGSGSGCDSSLAFILGSSPSQLQAAWGGFKELKFQPSVPCSYSGAWVCYVGRSDGAYSTKCSWNAAGVGWELQINTQQDFCAFGNAGTSKKCSKALLGTVRFPLNQQSGIIADFWTSAWLLRLFFFLLQIQHTEDMENEIDELLQEFEEKSGRTFLHTVCFY